MIIPKYQRVARENVPKAEPWADELLEPVHDQLKDITMALQAQLSFFDNFNAEVRDVKVSDGLWKSITLSTLRGKPLGVLPMWNSLAEHADFAWKVVDLNQIAVKYDFASNPTTEVSIRVLVLGR